MKPNFSPAFPFRWWIDKLIRALSSVCVLAVILKLHEVALSINVFNDKKSGVWRIALMTGIFRCFRWKQKWQIAQTHWNWKLIEQWQIAISEFLCHWDALFFATGLATCSGMAQIRTMEATQASFSWWRLIGKFHSWNWKEISEPIVKCFND